MSQVLENLPSDKQIVPCPRCKKSDTIIHNEGVWCPRCGKFVIPPNPSYTAHIPERPRAQQKTSHSTLRCAYCSRPMDTGDGIYDDGEWICWNCIN